VVGSVQLVLALQPNGPHRAELQKLLVHSSQRRKGVGKRLVHEIEHQASSAGRWLVVLDSERETVAEAHFYESVGYQRCGIIPNFALSSRGDYSDTVLFYKDLR
jgi:ribosomal protein S18 acetylase RimI-like enzyme